MSLTQIEGMVIERESQSELANAICEAVLDVLSQRETALLMELYDGYSQAEIARRWEMAAQSVSEIFLSMKEKLARHLTDCGFENYINE